jgi:hypothetical protein
MMLRLRMNSSPMVRTCTSASRTSSRRITSTLATTLARVTQWLAAETPAATSDIKKIDDINNYNNKFFDKELQTVVAFEREFKEGISECKLLIKLVG